MCYRAIILAAIFSRVMVFNLSVGFTQNGDSNIRFTAGEYRAHVEFLASDLLEGRSPGTRGGDLAAAYIAAQFQILGLDPVSDSSGYYQPVPLMRTTVNSEASLSISNANQRIRLEAPRDAVITSEFEDTKIDVEGEIYFAGYGIDAPEYGVSDYNGLIAEGKILLMLRGVPDYAKTRLPGKEKSLFGKTDFKLETARARGAKGVLFLLEKDQTKLFDSLREEGSGETIRPNFGDQRRLAVTGWINGDSTATVMALAGSSYDQLKGSADRAGFQAQKLGLNLSLSMTQAVRRFTSPNVIGILPGSAKKDEAVVFAAHYDGLGIGQPDKDGDRIYNGAADNAAGTSALIALAKAFKNRNLAPERTLIFIATTSEESGALGSRYYTEHPVLPLDRTVVLINIDGINRYGLYDDFFALASTASDAADALNKIAEPLGMKMSLSRDFEEAMYYSFDTESFCARGVAGFTIWQGFKMRGKTPEETFQYTRQFFGRHHNPSDEVMPDWNDEAALQHLQLYFLIGCYYADGGARPHLKPENPYSPLMKLRNAEGNK